MPKFFKTTETYTADSMTLPGRYYTSQEIFQAELERIFYERWLIVGRAEKIPQPGDYFLVSIGTESLIVVRNLTPCPFREGERTEMPPALSGKGDGGLGCVHAYYNVCRHRGTRLCSHDSGRFSATIQCPYHAWTYALDGRLIGAPLMDDVPGFDKTAYPLHAAGLVEWEGFLLVSLARQPAPFVEAFAPLLGKFAAWNLPALQVVKRIEYHVKANWKLIVQNYSECYHCPVIHPELARKSPYRSGQNDLFEGPFLGGFMDLNHAYGSLTLSGRACARPLPGVVGANLSRVYYYTLFPNTLLSLHPDYVMCHMVWPRGPVETLVTCEWMFAPEAATSPGFDSGDAVDFWDMTNRQDWQVCEQAQLGVSSRAYTPAPYSANESLLAAFDREYLRAFNNALPPRPELTNTD